MRHFSFCAEIYSDLPECTDKVQYPQVCLLNWREGKGREMLLHSVASSCGFFSFSFSFCFVFCQLKFSSLSVCLSEWKCLCLCLAAVVVVVVAHKFDDDDGWLHIWIRRSCTRCKRVSLCASSAMVVFCCVYPPIISVLYSVCVYNGVTLYSTQVVQCVHCE